MVAILKLWRHIVNSTPSDQNIRIEFHPDPIWNDGALGFFWWGRPNKNNNNKNKNINKMSSDMRSVLDLRNRYVVARFSQLLFTEELSEIYYEDVEQTSFTKNTNWNLQVTKDTNSDTEE